MSGKMTKFKDLLVDTPNRYTVNGEVKTIVFAPNAVTQEGTKDKAEYFNEMQKNGLYNVNATRAVEGTVEFYDIAIEGSDIFDVFDTQFIINFNETNTKLNPVLRFNGNNYYIRMIESFIDVDVAIGTLQKTYIGFLDSTNNKLKLFRNERKLTFDTIADAQAYTGFVEGDIIETSGYYQKGDGIGHKRIVVSTKGYTGLPTANGKYLILYDIENLDITHFGLVFYNPGNKNDQTEKLNNMFNWLRENKVRELKCTSHYTATYGEGEIYASGAVRWHDVILKGTGKIVSPHVDNLYLQIFKESTQGFNGNLSNTISNKSYSKFYKAIQNKNCTVVFIGDSITMGGNQVGQSKYYWIDMLKNELQKTFPEVNFTFKNRAIAGSTLSNFFNSLSWYPSADEINKSTGEVWITEQTKSNTWSSFVTSLNPDIVFSAFGMNQDVFKENYSQQLVTLQTTLNTGIAHITTPSRTISHAIYGSKDYSEYPYWNNINSCAEQTKNYANSVGDLLIDSNRMDKIISLGIDEENITFKGYYNVPYGATGVYRDVDVLSGILNLGTFTSTNDFSTIETKKYMKDVAVGFNVGTLNGAVKLLSRYNPALGYDGITIQISNGFLYLISNEISEGITTTDTHVVTLNTGDYVNFVIAKDDIKVYINKILTATKKCGSNTFLSKVLLYLTSSGDSITNLQINEGDYTRYIPALTDRQKYNLKSDQSLGDDLGTGANGLNHATSIAERYIYCEAIEQGIKSLSKLDIKENLLSSTAFNNSSSECIDTTGLSSLDVWEYTDKLVIFLKLKAIRVGQGTIFKLTRYGTGWTSASAFVQNPVYPSQFSLVRLTGDNGIQIQAFNPLSINADETYACEGYVTLFRSK